MNEHYYAVIMAGGGGTRLWPLSRQSQPKQMLKLIGNRSLFQNAVDRIQETFPPERILVVTIADQAVELRKSVPEIPAENYLIEPAPRGTASVVGLAAVSLQARDPQAVMAILTADHYVRDEALFRRLLESGYHVAQQGYLVTLGIEPTYPSTGYGYIKRGGPLGETQGFMVYQADSFREKPDLATAQEMLDSGVYAWNSGMFIWKASRIQEEFALHMPELNRTLLTISADWNRPSRAATIQKLWPGITPQTIDYGIMERAEKVAVIPAAGLGWNDVGSWDSLFEVIPADERGNIVLGAQHLGLDSGSSLVYSSNPEKMIVTIGVENLVVIDTGDALLVCNLGQTQQVRQVVNQLKKTGRSQYL